MKRLKDIRRKTGIMMVISLGFLILGFGCVSWALYNIAEPIVMPIETSDAAIVNSHQLVIPKAVEVASNEKSHPIKPLPDRVQSEKPKVFKEGDIIGSLKIPALNQKITIVQGTSNKSLRKGAGHFAQSVFPGVEDNCVISGHRDTVFKKIGKLKIGDVLIVKTAEGEFTYKVSGTRIVHHDDKTVIVPTDHAVLTLTTCYPFKFIGNAPERYIVSADLVQ